MFEGKFALGDNGLELHGGLGQDNDTCDSALEDAGGESGFVRSAGLGVNMVRLGEQVFHGDDLPSALQNALFAFLDPVKERLLVFFAVQGNGSDFAVGNDRAPGEPRYFGHMLIRDDDAVDAGLQRQGDQIFVVGDRFEEDGGHSFILQRV